MSTSSMVSEKREIEPFLGLKFSGIGHVFIKQGERTSLEVKAPAAVIQRIKTEVNSGVLEIGYKFAFFRWLQAGTEMKGIEFHITNPVYDSIISSGAGEIISEGPIKSKDLTLRSTGAGNTTIEVEASTIMAKVTGAGNINLTGKAGAQDVTINGAGKYDAFNLESNSASVHSTGTGQCFISVNQKLDVKITGVGMVKYKGSPAIQSSITGLGKLETGN